ncbi:MAG: nuclease-related domain-containing protein [Jaaginema sp. PMC 1079.18]|nr:nuclease-related domain-containing protein [Jaaginema sp. PMC 1080.18]MEC4853779.1 nuclease-related domain-containing protein [Jaaginema sp. PMC 1079.18]MEC4868884.1 nuclease-related domain-containing protein [Jaaginema sp. PMC 1078.18]
MKIYQQSPELRTIFQQQVDRKVSDRRQATHDALGGGILGDFGAMISDFQQLGNQIKGTMGEGLISMLLKALPDTWAMFNNALIPTASGKLTEIDHLIIGPGGIFLIEVKTWKGSYSAYKNKWKRRDRHRWLPISDSPTAQSAYHQKSFTRWLSQQLPSFSPAQDLISAPVVFPIAQWIGTTDCSVPVLTNAMELVQVIKNASPGLNSQQVEEITDKVRNCSAIATSKPTPKPVKIINVQSTSTPKPIKKKIPKPKKRID